VVGAVVTVEAPAAVSFAGAICALAATFGGDGSRRSEDGGAVETVAAEVNLVPRAGRPPPLYIAQCDGAHQPCRVGRPRLGRENKV
jgi:hypothetical protein